ncbi:MAG: hypothetical protein RIR01_2328 [Bacteroidota bacterium]|jgi:hypothetical protein
MSVISKTRAQEIAQDVFKKSIIANNATRDEIREDLYKEYMKTFSEEIQKFHENNKSCFANVNLALHDHSSCSVYRPIPCKNNSTYTRHHCDDLNRRWVKYDAKKREIEKAYKDLELHLITLRSKKRILEAYPEFDKYFAHETRTLVNLPAVQVDKMRELIANQPI